MKTAIRLITIADIPVRLHWTFVFLIAWIGYVAYLEGLSTPETLYFFLLVFGLFICVICHEFGHALTARKYNVSTRDIFILPFGGLARLESLPEDPKKEMIIAIAGPLVNIVIFILLFIFLYIIDGLESWSNMASIQSLLNPLGLVYAMALLNIMLFFFNLIPAFPMDGGRILRSLLSMKWGKRKATIFASYLAQLIGVSFFVGGIYKLHFTIILIGVFIFFTSAWERSNLEDESSDLELEEE